MCDLSSNLVLFCGPRDVWWSLNTGVKETLSVYKFSQDVINTCIISNSKFVHKKYDHCLPFVFDHKNGDKKIKHMHYFFLWLDICTTDPY